MALRFGRRKKIGLALGGGAARGWAHLGVIDALREKNIKIDFVAGTSIGSLVGGFYAAGRVEELRRLALDLNWKQVLYYFFDISFPRSGLVEGKKIVDMVLRHLKKTEIEDLDIPFRAVATDIQTGDEVVLDRGDLMRAIRASIAIPGIFTPVKFGTAVLVDGGLVNPVPVSIVRQMGADEVIAVNITHDMSGQSRTMNSSLPAASAPVPGYRDQEADWHPFFKTINDSFRQMDANMKALTRKWMAGDGLPTMFDVLGNSIRIVESQIAVSRLKLEKPEVLICPAVQGINFMDFHKAREGIAAGYEAARAAL